MFWVGAGLVCGEVVGMVVRLAMAMPWGWMAVYRARWGHLVGTGLSRGRGGRSDQQWGSCGIRWGIGVIGGHRDGIFRLIVEGLGGIGGVVAFRVEDLNEDYGAGGKCSFRDLRLDVNNIYQCPEEIEMTHDQQLG